MQVEWLLPDRRIAIPEHRSFTKAAENLVSLTGPRPHQPIVFSDEARERFDSFSAAHNIKSAKLRKGSNADAAAEEGSGCPP